MSPDMITAKEIASYLRISLPTVYKLIRSGEIPSVKVGGRYIVPREEFRTWVRSNTSGGDLLG